MLIPMKIFRTLHSLIKREITLLHSYNEDILNYPPYYSPNRTKSRSKILRKLRKWHGLNKRFVEAERTDKQYGYLSDTLKGSICVSISHEDVQKLLSLTRSNILVNKHDYSSINKYDGLNETNYYKSKFYALATKDGSLTGKAYFLCYNLASNKYRKQLKVVRSLEDTIKYLKKELKQPRKPKWVSLSKRIKRLYWSVTH